MPYTFSFLMTVCRNRRLHQRVFALALPMMLSNITVPLLGLVDTMVMGHLNEAYYLGGVAVGTMICALIIWLLGFLRMATTGVVAQAHGAGRLTETVVTLWRALLLALLLAGTVLLTKESIADLAFWLAGASAEVEHYGRLYFSIRIYGLPAALCQLVILGWLLGMQNARAPMWLLISSNLLNIVLNVILVLGLEWGVKGVAVATVVADYAALMLGSGLVWRQLKQQGMTWRCPWSEVVQAESLWRLMALNRDIFLRSLALQLCLTFMTFQGAKLGNEVVAANAVLMNFVLLVSFALDGVAYAAEALVGQAIGQRARRAFQEVVLSSLLWGGVFASGFTLLFAVGGEWIIGMMTDIDAVRVTAYEYLPWLIAVPLLSATCYIMDGIFIGATRAAEMRNSMLFAAFGVFFPLWWLTQDWQNHALWLAMSAFMLARGLGLLGYFWRAEQQHGFGLRAADLASH